MNWSKYELQFREAASKAGYEDDYVILCLSYAKSLFDNGLPIIFDQEHLSHYVGYSADYLRRASNSPYRFYREFHIPKKSGGIRKIAEPLPSLKEIQRWILDNILYCCKVSGFSKGFIPKKSIRSNARFHQRQMMVLSLDIKDFFLSIKSSRVYGFFKKIGYAKSVSVMLTELCTLNGSLPQGAPTSPCLSNLLSFRLDKRLSGFAIKNNIRYTRYADDLTFSGDFDPGSLIRLVRKVLKDEGLVLNEDKTRLMLRHNRQEVTGIVVNDKMQAPRSTRRNLRQAIYYIEKYGIDSHMEFTKNERANYDKHLYGIANFILFVNNNDLIAKKARKVLGDL